MMSNETELQATIAKIVAPGKERYRPAVDDLAGIRQRRAMADAIEQRQTKLVLELSHGLAYGGLGCEHHLGRFRKAALAHHLDKGSQRSKFHYYSIQD